MNFLSQIVKIQGIGLLHDTAPSVIFEKVTLIYGENGRGKSTLASVLRACAENRTDTLTSRQTLDSPQQPQHIHLLFQNDEKTPVQVQMNAGAWTNNVPKLQIFDAEFVSKNVYSGIDVNADHRASLLNFALGEDAVALRKKVDDALNKITDTTKKITAQTAILKVSAGDISVDAFISLPPSTSIAEELQTHEKRIAAANARAELLTKKMPAQASPPTFTTPALFAIMAKSLPEVNTEAERLVKLHLAKCENSDFETWVSQGAAFQMGADCPYCGSETGENTLINAYRMYFNQAYGTLKNEVATLERGLKKRLDDGVIDTLASAFNMSQAHMDGWATHVMTTPILFDVIGMKKSFAELRTLLEPLAAAKAKQPLASFGTAAQQCSAQNIWDTALSYVTTANQKIENATQIIDQYKKSLATEDIPALQKAIHALKRQQLRHTPAILSEIDKLNQLASEKTALTAEKDVARKELDALMKITLEKYQKEINILLNNFNAQLQIDTFDFNYRGGAGPRSDYSLKIRGCEISLTNGAGAGFGNSLSEGDKRSLAFAFFIAKLNQDPDLAHRIVVIDDPMCSLDRSRRTATIRSLKLLVGKCKQLIVLAHDLHFLQSLDDQLDSPKSKVAPPRSYCKITTAPNNYSTFGALNLANECATQYENDLKLITEFIECTQNLDNNHVATRLRVLVEASLHRQFPSLIPRDKTLGALINDIKKSKAPNRLAALHSSVPQLHELNDYAKRFHHSEEGEPADFTHLDEGELRSYCNKAIDFVLRGAA